MAGEPHSYRPKCVDLAIADFVMCWNDFLATDAERNRLIKPLLPEILYTRGSNELRKRRARLVLEWSTTFVTPAALSLAGFGAAAERLRTDASLENLRAIKQEVEAAAIERFGKAAWEYASACSYAYSYASASAYAYAYAYAKLDGKDFAPLSAALEEGATELVRRMIALKEEETGRSQPEQKRALV